MASFNQSGAHVSRPFHTSGSLGDLLCASKPKSPFFKKYMGQSEWIDIQQQFNVITVRFIAILNIPLIKVEDLPFKRIAVLHLALCLLF